MCSSTSCSVQPLSQEEVLEDISADHALKTVTLEAHPHISSGAGATLRYTAGFAYSLARRCGRRRICMHMLTSARIRCMVALWFHCTAPCATGLHASIHPCKHATVMQKLCSELSNGGRECRPEQARQTRGIRGWLAWSERAGAGRNPPLQTYTSAPWIHHLHAARLSTSSLQSVYTIVGSTSSFSSSSSRASSLPLSTITPLPSMAAEAPTFCDASCKRTLQMASYGLELLSFVAQHCMCSPHTRVTPWPLLTQKKPRETFPNSSVPCSLPHLPVKLQGADAPRGVRCAPLTYPDHRPACVTSKS